MTPGRKKKERKSSDAAPHRPGNSLSSKARSPRPLKVGTAAAAPAPGVVCPIESLTRSMGEFSLILDSKGVIRTLWALDEAPARPADLLGRHLRDALGGEITPACKELFKSVLETGASEEIKYQVEMRDGLRWFSARVMRVAHAGGGPKTIGLFVRDVSGRVATYERLVRSEALLVQAERLACLGSWERNLETNEVTWSDQCFRVLGIEPGEALPTFEHFKRMIHPADREREAAEVARAIARHEAIDGEIRLVLPSGAIRTMHRRAIPFYDPEGKPIRLAGMSQDVTERKAEEERLRHREAILDQAEEIAHFGSWEYNFETRRYTLSRQLLRMYGFESPAEWDEDIYWKRLHPADRSRVREISGRAVAECKPFEFTARYFLPGGGVRVLHGKAVVLAGPGGSAARVRGVVRDITEETRTEEDLHRLSQELIRLRDAERRELSRELHESAGQTLAALKMSLGNLAEALSGESESGASAGEHLLAARQLADDAVREIRVVSYLMHPAMLDESGLGPALRWYARGFAERSGIETKVDVPENFGRQSEEIEMTVFRIVQEALTNVHRYSGSRTASIRLSLAGGKLAVEIEDEGCGLPAPANLRDAPYGVGIAGMRERVTHHGGEFEIESAPGRGAVVRAVLPLPSAEARDSGLVPESAPVATPFVTPFSTNVPPVEKGSAKAASRGHS